MKIFINITLLLCFFLPTYAQEGFVFPPNKKKISIPFKLVSNLVILPIKVNDVELNFLLDTGVEETILFSLENNEKVELYNVEKITLKGLGNQDAVQGLKSSKNKLTVGSSNAYNQEILIVIDELMDFSSSLGIPVNGIIGYQFFKHNLVEVDYVSKKVHIYNRSRAKIEKVTRNFTPLNITVERNKPYLESKVVISDEQIPAKLLLDTGNSDAIWLFQQINDKVIVPETSIDDFLGRGFSGEIYGKKARISNFMIDKFEFANPIVSFPDSASIRNVKMVTNRIGSIGGEVFKRFTIIFDYQTSKLYVKKNSHFNTPFHYNMSGIELHHVGLRLVQEKVRDESLHATSSVKMEFSNSEKLNVRYKFELKPAFEIASVRKNSPAEKIGLKKGDLLISINNSMSYHYTLQEINELLKSESGRVLLIEIEREGKVLLFQLKLENLL